MVLHAIFGYARNRLSVHVRHTLKFPGKRATILYACQQIVCVVYVCDAGTTIFVMCFVVVSVVLLLLLFDCCCNCLTHLMLI